MLALIGNFAAFTAAFVIACAGIRAVLPEQRLPIVSPKLDWLAQHGDEYDALFIGSSRTFRQLLPEIFDAEMTAAGYPVRAFNAGVDGMRPPEDTYMMEKILAHRTRPLRYVLVECNPIRLRQRAEDRDTLRAVYWHDNVRMMTMFRAAFFADPKKRSWGRRLEKIVEIWPDFTDHAGYWMLRNSNLGRGHDLLAEWLGVVPPKGNFKSGLGTRSDGHKPFDQGEVMSEKMTADYEKELAAMRSKAGRGTAGDVVSLAELRVKQRLIERAGGRMVLVIPPIIGDNIFRPKPGDGTPPLLDFSNPEKYPELFMAKHHSDTGHTNNAGARIYTRLVARELAELLKREGR